MRRPVVTARMLEDLRHSQVEFRLCKSSIVTPAARDWLREHPVPIVWVDPADNGGMGRLALVMEPKLPEMRAARMLLDRSGLVAEVIEPPLGPGGYLSATRRLCGKISRKEVHRGIIFAPDAAMPVCVANKHRRIRAALGMNVPMVAEACRDLGINVLVIEYPHTNPYQMKQMVLRFLAGGTSAPPETAAAIEIIEQAGGETDW